MPSRQPYRKSTRLNLRRPLRQLNRAGLRGRRRGPDDFAQMLTAYGQAIRAHRQLARLAPSFFDAAVVDRERENRMEKRKWMALWEPALAKAYGVPPEPPDLAADLPQLPPPNMQRVVERQLAEVQSWLAAGELARQRQQQRRPHALPTLSQLARLLQLAFDLKKMVLGLDSKNPLPDKLTYDYEFTDLKRAYGHLFEPTSPVALAPGGAIACGAAPIHAPVLPLVPVDPPAVVIGGASVPASRLPPNSDAMPAPRCDAWSRLARQIRKRNGIG